jgi:hypothetical protein
MAARIVTGGGIAGSHARMAIYNIDNDCSPTTVVADTGDISTASSGVITGTVSAPLQPGLYYLAIWASAAINISQIPANSQIANMGWDATGGGQAFINYLLQNTAYGTAFPSLGGVTLTKSITASLLPMIGIR